MFKVSKHAVMTDRRPAMGRARASPAPTKKAPWTRGLLMYQQGWREMSMGEAIDR
jgi:hypothetical protein